jgi:hypothetical protein
MRENQPMHQLLFSLLVMYMLCYVMLCYVIIIDAFVGFHAYINEMHGSRRKIIAICKLPCVLLYSVAVRNTSLLNLVNYSNYFSLSVVSFLRFFKRVRKFAKNRLVRPSTCLCLSAYVRSAPNRRVFVKFWKIYWRSVEENPIQRMQCCDNV